MSEFVNNSIFWIEVEKIQPNPYQPRKEFNEAHLRDLADSIRQYGVLQPLVVTRSEIELPEGGMQVKYELIAGERRLRASKLAGIARVPVIIQAVTDPRLKLELAIIENLQREDLNPVDRALSFARLAQEFSLKHVEIAKKVGKSREYVSNSLRLLVLPKEILDALAQGRITEGHARPLMMLSDRKEEQTTLYKEILFKKLTVREAEAIARHIAQDKIRKKLAPDPEMERIEKDLAETLGTRVSIERRQVGGGKVVIDFFSSDDLRSILDKVHLAEQLSGARALRQEVKSQATVANAMSTLAASTPILSVPLPIAPRPEILPTAPAQMEIAPATDLATIVPMVPTGDEDAVHAIDQDDILSVPYDDSAKDDNEGEDESLYSVKDFSI
jgi:ParB family chromosome partitioning protein